MPEPLPGESEASLRASDADREAVVERLRQAHSEGRLDLGEFDERTRTAYAARTYAELATLTRDLPAEDGPAAGRLTAAVAGPSATEPAVFRPPARGLAWRIIGSAWFFASFVNFVIWAIVCLASGDWVHPWWIWVAGPWGAVLVAHWLGEQARRGR